MLRNGKKVISTQNYRRAYIKANRNRCMNLNEGLEVTTIYGKGKDGKRKFT